MTCVHGASRSSTFSAVDQGDPRLREREGVDDCVTSRGKIPGKKIKTTKLGRSLEAIDGIGRLLMFSWAWRTEALTDDRLSSGRRDSDPCNTKIAVPRRRKHLELQVGSPEIPTLWFSHDFLCRADDMTLMQELPREGVDDASAAKLPRESSTVPSEPPSPHGQNPWNECLHTGRIIIVYNKIEVNRDRIYCKENIESTCSVQLPGELKYNRGTSVPEPLQSPNPQAATP